MIIELLLGFIFILTWLFIDFHEWPSLRTMRLMRQFPGPPGVFFFGHGPALAKVKYEDILMFFGSWYKKYGPIFKIWRLGIPGVILTDPIDIETILSSTQHLKKGLAYERLKDWLNEGLLLSKGLKWKERRKLLTPAFHFKILEDCIHHFNKDSISLLNELLGTQGKDVEIEEYISKFTLHVLCETAMGLKLDGLPDSGDKYRNAVKRINYIISKRIMSPIYMRDWFYNLSPLGREQARIIKTIHSFTNMVIEERRQLIRSRSGTEDTGKTKKKGPKTFLDCLIELSENDPKLFTQDDIREEVDTFMFEGHDTTSAAITAAIYMIGHHPEIQEQIVKELVEVIGTSDREITMSDLHDLKYLDCVLKETLRLFPSVPTILRRLESDMPLRDGKYIVPATASIIIFPYWLHRNPDIFPQPEVFIPERFLSDELSTRHPYSYIPFSGGPRNCIGQRFAMMEMKIALATILRKAKIQSVTKLNEIKMGGGLILRPNSPFKVKINKRHLQ